MIGLIGRIYEDYSKANITNAVIEPHEQLMWMHDQNFTPLSSAIGVRRNEGKDLYLLDEIVLISAVSKQSAAEFVDKFKEHKNKHVLIYAHRWRHEWVEHTGTAIEAGRKSLEDLEDQMLIAGAKLLQKDKQSTKTATQAEEEAAQETSPLQTMAGQLEDTLDQVLQYFALWKGEKEGGHVKVNGNFDVDFAPETTLPLLLNMTTQGRLSDETLFNEYKRRGVVSDDIEWEAEKQKIADQGPALGAL